MVLATSVQCPFCNAELDLSEDKWIQVDAPNHAVRLFCNWKHLGRWVMETYERGRQFEERLEE